MMGLGKPVTLFFQMVKWPSFLVSIPRAQMTSIFEGQPPKKRPFPFKTMVIWVPGICQISGVFVIILQRPGVNLRPMALVFGSTAHGDPGDGTR